MGLLMISTGLTGGGVAFGVPLLAMTAGNGLFTWLMALLLGKIVGLLLLAVGAWLVSLGSCVILKLLSGCVGAAGAAELIRTELSCAE
jgi:hypothetical protein